MTDDAALCQDLQALWHRDFPLSKAMDLRVQTFKDRTLASRASLAPNTNTHGTAFAGSLYAIQALTAWGLIYLELQIMGLDASIVHASGKIEFAKPVQEDIVALACFDDDQTLRQQLQDRGKARLELTTTVHAGDDTASRFAGVYVVRLNRRTAEG